MDALIELDEITKHFGSLCALDHVSLDIRPGITGLLGPNGAGKSTLIKVLLGLLRTTSGRGRVLEYDLGRQQRAIRAHVGYMPEDDCFLSGLTGVESIQVSARLSRYPRIEGLRRAHEILDFCGTGQERYRPVETYSTGMRQKLRFAQALVHDPQILILDEPTSGLDPEEREIMLNRIALLSREHGKTVLLCTHILPDVQAVSDHVVILAQGRVRVAGRLDELSRPASPSLQVRPLGDAHGFAEGLREAGLRVEIAQNGTLIVEGSQAELSATIWRIAEQANVGIRLLRTSRTSLEDIFLDAVREQPHGIA